MVFVVVVIIVALGAMAVLRLGSWSRGSGRGYVAAQWRYQPAALLVAVIAVALCSLLVPDHANVLRWGTPDAPATGLAWLGVSDGDSWSTVGLTFLVIMTIVTAVVVYLQVGRGVALTAFVRALPLAMVFAIVNSLAEELLFRVTVVQSLSPVWGPVAVAALAAAVFGIPHWLGVPGRVPGVILAAFMGYFLALSILQTQGIVWAWGIHAVQDVVIMVMLIGRELPAQSAKSPTRTPE
jgi:membrane protease YdiL (CAAX protease family)